MDTRLESLFRPIFRQAESADTRLGIRRDEQRDQRSRNKDRDKNDDDQSQWEDHTFVSLPALQIFLQSLIGAPGMATTTSIPEAPPSISSPPPAAAAAKAYQTTARGGHPAVPPPPAASATPATNLTPEEQQAVRRLLVDLDFLAAKNIAQLEIWRGDNFLQSLIDAAARARLALG